ncbi:hypothetical protein [Roseibium sp. SCP14]|uniref:hypothetical protein n=1 Tax=Roseibium sp. SCP14 TaxID=3141375 RepID=UPI003334DEE2
MSALLATPGLASESLCTLKGEVLLAKLQNVLPGQWHVHNTFGTLSFNGRTMPLPDGNDAIANITAGPRGLQISDLPAAGPYDLSLVEDARYSLDLPSKQVLKNGKALFGEQPDLLSDDEIRTLACGDYTPQLHAKGQFQDPEGSVDFDLYLFVINSGSMYGVVRGELKSMGGVAKRLIYFQKL